MLVLRRLIRCHDDPIRQVSGDEIGSIPGTRFAVQHEHIYIYTYIHLSVMSDTYFNTYVCVQLLFLLYTSELFSILKNKLIGYADDSTFMAVVPSPGVRVAVAESQCIPSHPH